MGDIYKQTRKYLSESVYSSIFRPSILQTLDSSFVQLLFFNFFEEGSTQRGNPPAPQLLHLFVVRVGGKKVRESVFPGTVTPSAGRSTLLAAKSHHDLIAASSPLGLE